MDSERWLSGHSRRRAGHTRARLSRLVSARTANQQGSCPASGSTSSKNNRAGEILRRAGTPRFGTKPHRPRYSRRLRHQGRTASPTMRGSRLRLASKSQGAHSQPRERQDRATSSAPNFFLGSLARVEFRPLPQPHQAAPWTPPRPSTGLEEFQFALKPATTLRPTWVRWPRAKQRRRTSVARPALLFIAGFRAVLLVHLMRVGAGDTAAARAISATLPVSSKQSLEVILRRAKWSQSASEPTSPPAVERFRGAELVVPAREPMEVRTLKQKAPGQERRSFVQPNAVR